VLAPPPGPPPGGFHLALALDAQCRVRQRLQGVWRVPPCDFSYLPDWP
jgi:hypothetical protein